MKHISILLSVCLLLLGGLGGWPRSAYADDTGIVISEIMSNAINEGSHEGEWVELYNKSANSVDMANWQLEDNSGTSDTITTSMCPSGSCSIPAGGCWLVAITQTNLQNEFSNYTNPSNPSVDTAKTIFLGTGQRLGNGLANTDDRLILRNNSGIAVDCYSWDGSGTCAGLTYVTGGNGVDDNKDGSDGQSETNIQGTWYDHQVNASPYACENKASSGSATSITLHTLSAQPTGINPGVLALPMLGLIGAGGVALYRRRRKETPASIQPVQREAATEYAPPAITYESRLEVRAGSPLSPVFDPTNLMDPLNQLFDPAKTAMK